MKKIVAIISLLAVILTLAACKPDTSKQDPQEALSNVNVANSERVAASIQAETEIVEKMEEVGEELGKTQKNKQIIYTKDASNASSRFIITFNRRGVVDSVEVHKFYKAQSSYDVVLDMGDFNNMKIIESDDNLRYVAYKYTEHPYFGKDFDYVYSAVSGSKDLTVIE